MVNNSIIKILILNTLVLIFFNFAHPVTPQMLIDKQMPDSVNGIMYSLMSLGMVVGSPYFGKKLKKQNITTIMVYSTILYAFAQQLFCYGKTVYIMGLGRLLSGFMAGGWIVASLYYVNKHSSENDKGKNLAYIMVSNSLAAVIGQLVSGYLGTTINYTYIFTIQLLGLILVGILAKIIIQEKPTSIKKEIVNDKSSLSQDNKVEKSRVEKVRYLMIPMIYMLLFSLAYTSINSQLGYYAQEELNKSTFFIGFLNSYVNIISLLVNLFVIHRIYTKLKSPNIFILKSSLSILGVVLFLIAPNTYPLVFFTLIICGLVSYKPVLQKIVADMSDGNVAEAFGYLNSANSIGMVLGGFIIGIAYQINKVYVIYIVLMLLIIILCISLILKIKTKSKI